MSLPEAIVEAILRLLEFVLVSVFWAWPEAILEFLEVVFWVPAETLIVSAVGVPLLGVLVRYRANYVPRIARMNGRSGNDMVARSSSPTELSNLTRNGSGTPVNGYFAMMGRVYMLEGMAGFLKGFVPIFLVTFCALAVFTLYGKFYLIGFSPIRVLVLEQGMHWTVIYVSISYFIQIPFQILINRAITTPYKLLSEPHNALRVLLSPSERRSLSNLYFAPGILAAVGAQFLLTCLSQDGFVLLQPITRVMFGSQILESKAALVDLMMSWVWAAMCATLLAPVEVITVRLMIQRNHLFNGMADGLRMMVEEAEKQELEECSNGLVIGLRDERDPYLGFFNCAKRVFREEGWRVFFRAWWVTVLGQGLYRELA